MASDFWHSADFARDFEQARSQGFRQIGRFGIGFLSVFMLGDEIEVDTERAGSTHIRLKLRGLGRRGELRETASTGHVGTRIKIKLNPTATDRLVNLPEIARARAPMLPYTITTSVKRANDVQKTTIDPGWWRLALAKDIRSFVEKWHATATEGSFIEDRENVRRRNFYRPFSFKEGGWTGTLPEAKSDLGRLISMGTDSPEPILVCSNGIAVRVRSHLDLTGLVDAGDMAMFPDRGSADEFGHVSPNDPEAISIFALTDSVRPKVRNSISELASSGMMPSRYPFLRIKVGQYGSEVLLDSSFPWIPMVEPTGDLIHRSRINARSRISTESKVILCFGGNPLTSYEHASANLARRQERILGIALSLTELKVDYTAKSRIEAREGTTLLRGTLAQLAEKVEERLDRFIMGSLLLGIVADSWQLDPAAFDLVEWFLNIEFGKEGMWTLLVRR